MNPVVRVIRVSAPSIGRYCQYDIRENLLNMLGFADINAFMRCQVEAMQYEILSFGGDVADLRWSCETPLGVS